MAWSGNADPRKAEGTAKGLGFLFAKCLTSSSVKPITGLGRPLKQGVCGIAAWLPLMSDPIF